LTNNSLRQAKTRKGREDDGEMCRAKLKDRKSYKELIETAAAGWDRYSVLDVLRRNRLKWFGHVERKTGRMLMNGL